MHNPLKNPDRYQMWGSVFLKIARGLEEHENYFMK
jgi:hypothetical protein